MKRLSLALWLFASFALTAVASEPVIYLVRHAEKAQDGDSKDPDLSPAGRARAQNLKAIVKEVGITAIFATEFKRTQQTAEPLSQLTKIPVTIVPGKETAALIAQLMQVQGCALVVGHSNTLPEIIKALGVASEVRIGDSDYDDIFVVKTETKPPEFMHLHYR